MDFSDHTFSKIKFQNGPDETPKLTLVYTAVAPDDTLKDAKDAFPGAVPHQGFLDEWYGMMTYWKRHIEWVLGTVDWDLRNAYPTTIKLTCEAGEIVTARYWVTARTENQEAVTISTPEVPVAPEEKRHLNAVCAAAGKFLAGARGEPDLFDDGDNGALPDHRTN